MSTNRLGAVFTRDCLMCKHYSTIIASSLYYKHLTSGLAESLISYELDY